MASGTATPSLTALKRHPDLQHLKSEHLHPAAASGEGIHTPEGILTPGHAHHFSNKGIDPIVLNSSLKQHIAQGAVKGERKLNDFSADVEDRLNPHFDSHLEEIKNAMAPVEHKDTLEVPTSEQAQA
ncbi:SubName: Full=Uncharacterized protein {ECO:0000313/EMBL:CCA66559.1} [Serendipita indica DSM 11827]|nr:SubName: Full=Uncharacterized protein {ECO:0000313/EMBL:CCA66559.1} [Serendipita indica DSM 11827]